MNERTFWDKQKFGCQKVLRSLFVHQIFSFSLWWHSKSQMTRKKKKNQIKHHFCMSCRTSKDTSVECQQIYGTSVLFVWANKSKEMKQWWFSPIYMSKSQIIMTQMIMEWLLIRSVHLFYFEQIVQIFSYIGINYGWFCRLTICAWSHIQTVCQRETVWWASARVLGNSILVCCSLSFWYFVYFSLLFFYIS